MDSSSDISGASLFGFPFLAELELYLGTPSSFDEAFKKPVFGGSLRLSFQEHWAFGLDFFLLATEYYYPVSGSTVWQGPVPWSSVPSSFGSTPDDWIFKHSVLFFAPNALYRFNADPVFFRLGTGPALAFALASEAADYYPELAEQYRQFLTGFETFIGWELRLGVEYRPMPWLIAGVEYLFIIDSFIDFWRQASTDFWEYADRAGSLIVFAGVSL